MDEDEIDYALCGGLALAVHARPRATLDIDSRIESALLSVPEVPRHHDRTRRLLVRKVGQPAADEERGAGCIIT